MPPRTQRAMAKPENTVKALKRIFSYMYGRLPPIGSAPHYIHTIAVEIIRENLIECPLRFVFQYRLYAGSSVCGTRTGF